MRYVFIKVLQRCNPLGKTKVTQADILVVVEKDIFWLNVSVYYIPLVQIVYCLKDLSIDLPLKFFRSFLWVIDQELFKSLTVTKLHLDVKNLDTIFGASACVLTFGRLTKYERVLELTFLGRESCQIALLMAKDQLLILFHLLVNGLLHELIILHAWLLVWCKAVNVGHGSCLATGLLTLADSFFTHDVMER